LRPARSIEFASDSGIATNLKEMNMSLLTTLLAFLETKFAFLFTAVSGVFNTIVSELPDDEIAILHGAMVLAGNDLKAGKSAAETFTDTLNYVGAQEKGELSKVGSQLLQAFITATAPSA
jgi:hypothetical protein